MKTILEIIKKKQSDTIGLFSLKKHTTYHTRDVFINPERNHWSRLDTTTNTLETFEEKDYRKVVAFNLNAIPVIKIYDEDAKILNNHLEEGFPFLEVECREDGYPLLTEDNRLIVYDRLTFFTSNITPEEALERIKEFNESFTNNHKLTPGLHESS
jgi:hypothetical protein